MCMNLKCHCQQIGLHPSFVSDEWFVLQSQDWVFANDTAQPPSLKYLFSGSLEKKFADACFGMSFDPVLILITLSKQEVYNQWSWVPSWKPHQIILILSLYQAG